MSSKSQVKSQRTQAHLKEVGRIAGEGLEGLVDFVALKNKLRRNSFHEDTDIAEIKTSYIT